MSELGTVRTMFEAFARRDIEAALLLLHPQVEWRPYATTELAGRAAPYRGHEGIRQYFRDVEKVWTRLELMPEDYRAVAGSVVIFGRVRASGPAGEVDTPVMWMWKLRDGLVCDGHVYPVGERRPD